MTRYLGSALALLVLLLPLLASAQSVTNGGTIASATDAVNIQALNTGNGAIQATGTWTGTLRLQCKVTAGNLAGSLVTVPLNPIAGGAAVTSFTGNGTWLFTGPFTYCEVNASAWGSGTATILVLATNASVPPTLSSVGAVGGSGTTGTYAKFTGATTVGNALLTESGTTITVPNADTFALGTSTVTGTPTWGSTQTLNTSGNAGTATVLQTPRAINGVNFNGSAPITITAAPSGSAGGDLTGTYPNPGVAWTTPGTIGSTTPNTGAFTSVTIAPAAASTTQAINAVQTGPTTGSQGTGVNYNLFQVTSEGANVGNVLNEVAGTKFYMATGGSNVLGARAGVWSEFVVNVASTSSPGDQISGLFRATATANVGGTNTGAGATGSLYALNPFAKLLSGGTNWSVVSGAEVDVGIETGGSAAKRLGWSLVGFGDLPAASWDAALEIGAATAGSSWKTPILFSSLHGVAPVTTGGTLIGTDGASVTTTNALDFHTYTFTGDLLYFPNFRATAAGNLSLNNATSNTSIATYYNGPALNQKTTDGTANNTLAYAFYGNGGNSFAAIVAQITDQTGGAVKGVLAFLTANGAAAAAEAGRFSPSGGFSVGTTADPGAGVINVLTGYRIGNVGTSGHVLRGNGTNFVDAALAAADLSNGTTGSGGGVMLATGPTSTNNVISGTSTSITNVGTFALRDTTAAFDDTIVFTSTSATLTAGRTLTVDVGNVAHTIQLGTTANTITFPNAASGTVPLLNLAQTFTAVQTINLNAAALPTTLTGADLRVGGVDGTNNILEFVAAGGSIQLVGRRAANTLATPQATLTGTTIMYINAMGHDGTNWGTSSRAGMLMQAAETWTTTANGMKIIWQTTANTTLTTTTNMTLDNDGTLNVVGIYKQNGTSGCTGVPTAATGGLSTTCTSDERLKTISGPYSGGLKALAMIQPYRYRWNELEPSQDPSREHLGFTAQNVKAAIPEAAWLVKQADGREWYTLEDRAILATAVNAVKELQARVEALEQRRAGTPVASEWR